MATSIQNRSSKDIRHLGKRPRNDEDNPIREKLSRLVQDVGCFHEICAEKLYLVNLARDEDPEEFCENAKDPNCPFIFWHFGQSPDLKYENFNQDFGPFNLAMTHQFISKLKVWLDTQPHRSPDKYIVIVLDEYDIKRKLNGTLLVAIAAMVLLNMTSEEVIQKLGFFMMPKSTIGRSTKQLSFRQRTFFSDVSGNHSLMRLTLKDCIEAFYSALREKFYDYYEFDHAEYLFYETVISGDLNWIVPNKILAFAGPSDEAVAGKVSNKHAPQFYHEYFRQFNVTTIIRLNESEYDKSGFQDYGFDHHDLIFLDGYPPTSPIAAKFIKIVDEAKGAVAVHCYAGIGRTGTLIAAYLMARYNFTPQTAIAWTRICRPGSVIGEQQDWLYSKFDQYSISKNTPKTSKSRKLETDSDEATFKEDVASESNSDKTLYQEAEETYGQAKALLLAKKHRESHKRASTRYSPWKGNSADSFSSSETPEKRASTRHSSWKGNSTDSFSSSKTLETSKKADIVLDLGMTVPLMLRVADFLKSEQENPKTYLIKDNQYEWLVKFPQPRYVTLKHDLDKDLSATRNIDLDYENLFNRPTLRFRYTFEEVYEKTNDELRMVTKMRPMVCYSCTNWFDE